MTAAAKNEPGIWFPTIRAGTGTDIFTERLAEDLEAAGIRTAIDWLPLRAEYAPWTVRTPAPPRWATICHVNTWLHPRFIPCHLPVVATLHHAVHAPSLRRYKGWTRAAYHRFWIAPIERRVLNRADRVVAVSRYAADQAHRTLCNVPIQVIRNGIDIDAFQPGQRARQPHEPFRLLYVGTWIRRKGIDLLAPIMRELGDGFELHYTGGPAAERDKSRMSPNMHDVGHLSTSQVISAMQHADAFLFPSRSEGFGLAVAEAMACGLPVIASADTAVAELVEDSLTGFLCSGSLASFVTAIRCLAQDPDLHQSMKAAARKQALQFSATQVSNSYLRVYASLAHPWRESSNT